MARPPLLPSWTLLLVLWMQLEGSIQSRRRFLPFPLNSLPLNAVNVAHQSLAVNTRFPPSPVRVHALEGSIQEHLLFPFRRVSTCCSVAFCSCRPRPCTGSSVGCARRCRPPHSPCSQPYSFGARRCCRPRSPRTDACVGRIFKNRQQLRCSHPHG